MAHRDFFHFPKLRVHPFAVSGLFILLFVMPRAYTFAVLSSVTVSELLSAPPAVSPVLAHTGQFGSLSLQAEHS
jgi:hypothetical protein